MGGANSQQNTQIPSVTPNVIRGTEKNDYNTPLGHLEPAYQMYRANLGDQGNDQNYDLRGYWLNNVFMKNNGEHVKGEHFTDFYKKPSHPTASDESQYMIGKPAGHWVDDHSFRPASGTDINKLRTYLQSPEGEGMAVQDVK